MHSQSIQDAVWKAADTLMAQGVRPTVANVREITQRGSAGTINNILKDWWQQLAKRIALQQHVDAQLPQEIIGLVQQLWQQALLAGEVAFERFKQQAEDKITAADTSKITALERQQHAENSVKTLEAQLNHSQHNERALQTQLATELALRQQTEQQQKQLEQQHHDLEQHKHQLEKELALLAAQYQHQEQQLKQKFQQIEREFADYKTHTQQQLNQYSHHLQTSEQQRLQREAQHLQTQNELHLLQQQFDAMAQENKRLQQQNARVGLSKKEALKAKLQRYA